MRSCRECGKSVEDNYTKLLCRFHRNQYQANYRKQHLEYCREVSRRSRRKMYAITKLTKSKRLCRICKQPLFSRYKLCTSCFKAEKIIKRIEYLIQKEIVYVQYYPDEKQETVLHFFLCWDCSFSFKAKIKLLDATCPKCHNIHILKVKE